MSLEWSVQAIFLHKFYKIVKLCKEWKKAIKINLWQRLWIAMTYRTTWTCYLVSDNSVAFW